MCITLLSFFVKASAQVGIGTVSPNSTLQVSGSFAAGFRSFSVNTIAGPSDFAMAFTGATSSILTLPDATKCAGRVYLIKNISPTLPIPALTINTTLCQTIEGFSFYLMMQANQSLVLISDGANWQISAQAGGTVSGWMLGGNNIATLQNLGTTSNNDLPFITNNIENMRLSAVGNLAVGTSVFNTINPEKLVVNAGITNSVNAIVGKGSINNYLQLNIQNYSSGSNASSDVVATADNGNETTNYVDLGVNSSGNSSGVMGNANDAYLYTTGNNFLIGTANPGKALVFLSGGTIQSNNERMRIDGTTGYVGIGTTTPSSPLHVVGINPLTLVGVQSGSVTDSILTINSGIVRKLSFPSVTSGNSWSLTGNAGTSTGTNFIGTTDNQSLIFKANNIVSGKIDLALNNTIFGYQAAQNPSGLNNAFIGYQSGYSVTNGASNAGLGSITLVSLTSGSGNSAVGYASLRNNTIGGGITAIGNNSGLTNVTGSDNLFIGYGADATSAGLNNATAIGYNAKVATSNSIILGGSGTNAVNTAIGTNTFNANNSEKLVVSAGTTNSVNAIVGNGSLNNYLQLNIQNQNNGTNASSDVVATADNGTELVNYVDLGINSSGNSSGVMGGANDAYLYTTGNNFLIGTGTAGKALVFMSGGTIQSANERMRIDGTTGNVGIGTSNPGNKLEINSGTGGASGLRLKELPAGAILFMSSAADVSQNNNNLYFDATNYRLSIAAGTSPNSTLQDGGSFSAAIVTKTASYTASVSDHTILCNNNAGSITIGLPSAAGCQGRIYAIKKISAPGNSVIIAGYNGTETIDGSTSVSILVQYSSLMIQSDGTNWYIISNN